MTLIKWLAVVILSYAIILGVGYSFVATSRALTSDVAMAPPTAENGYLEDSLDKRSPVASSYRLEDSQSRFIAHALSGGLLWFKGHDHLVAVRQFTGEARLDPDSIGASSLQITAKAASMEETSSVFTEPQKKIINKELREIVLLPDQYPDIVFKSTTVTGKTLSAGQYDLKIEGNLTLHGVTRPIKIPTKVTVTGNDLRAQGEFSINRGDFKVKATSAMHGLIRVRDKVKFEFNIVGHRL